MQIVIPVLVFEPVIFHSQDVVVKKMQALSLCVEFCALCDILLHGFSFVNENLQALKYRRRGKTDSHRKNVRKYSFSPYHISVKLFNYSVCTNCISFLTENYLLSPELYRTLQN